MSGAETILAKDARVSHRVPGHNAFKILERRDEVCREIREWYSHEARMKLLEDATDATQAWLNKNEESYSSQGEVVTGEGWLPSPEFPSNPNASFAERALRETWNQAVRGRLFEHGLQKLLHGFHGLGGVFPYKESIKPFLAKSTFQGHKGESDLVNALIVKWSTSGFAADLCREAFKHHLYNRDMGGTEPEMTLADVHALSPASPNTSPARQGPLVFEMMILGLLDMDVVWKTRAGNNNPPQKIAVRQYEIRCGWVVDRFYRAIYHPFLERKVQ